MSNSSILGFMMEALEEDLELDGEITEEEMEAADDNADAGVDESAPVEEQIGKLQTAIEVVENAAELASDVAEDVKESLEHGGLTAKEAYHVSKRLEAALSLTGTPGVTFSQEAFEEEGGRLAQTQYMLEGISEKLKAMWEAIKRFVANMWEKVKDFFNLSIRKAASIKKTAVKLKVKLAEGVSDPKEATIDIGVANASMLVSEDGTVKTKTLANAITTLPAKGVVIDAELAVIKKIKAALENDKNISKAVLADLRTYSISEWEKKTSKKFRVFGPSQESLSAEGEYLIGNRQIKVTITGDRMPKAKLVAANTKLKLESGKVDAANKALVNNILTAVSRSADIIAGDIKVGEQARKAVDEVLKAGDKLAKSVDEKDAPKAAATRALMSEVRMGMGSAAATSHACVKHNLSVMAAALSYCDKSISNMSK